MLSLLLAALFFIGIHLGIAGTALRGHIVAAIGEGVYITVFAIASAAGLAWIIMAYNHAPYIAAWGVLEWWKPWAILLMLPSTLLVVAGLTTPNPTSVAQANRLAEEPRGIVRVTRHPFLTGVALWALIHIVGNGDAASLIFFSTFAIVALAGTVSIDAKRRRLAGDAWEKFAAVTSIIPFAAIAAGRNHFSVTEISTWRWMLGFIVFALLFGGHGPLLGLSPLPT